MTDVKHDNNDYKKHYYKHEPDPHYRIVYWHDRPLRAGEKAYMERYLNGLKGERSEPIMSHQPIQPKPKPKQTKPIQKQPQQQKQPLTNTLTQTLSRTLSDEESQILYSWLDSLPDAN
jgi:hypothetical protein